MNHEATIATLNMQLDNCAKDLYEKDKRIAELERQLEEAEDLIAQTSHGAAERISEMEARLDAALSGKLAQASAPAVEQQPFGYFREMLNHEGKGNGVYLGVTEKKVSEQGHIPGETSETMIELYAAPQAADTDKVRLAEAWMTEDGERVVTNRTMEGAKRDGGAMLSSMAPYSVALVRATSMAAQAPVREVPDMRPGVEAVINLIQKQCDDYHREHGSQEPDTGVWNYPGDGNEWMCDREELLDEIRALLPAAPVQQEGASNA